jgi:hypothetical protein
MIQNKSNTKRTYRVMPNFTNQTVIDFFSYLRFVLYDEEMSTLLNVNNNIKQAILIRKEENSDEKPAFYTIPPLLIKNEIKVLGEIEKMCFNALNRYTTDYETDLKIIEELNKNQIERSENYRNCLLMRIGEKKVDYINLDIELLFKLFTICIITVLHEYERYKEKTEKGLSECLSV